MFLMYSPITAVLFLHLQGHCIVNKLLGFLVKFKYWITFISSLQVTFTGGNTMLWWSDRFELALLLSNSNDFWTLLWVCLAENEKLLLAGGSSRCCVHIQVCIHPPLPKNPFCLMQMKCECRQISELTEPTGSKQRGEWGCRRDVLQRLLLIVN